MRASLEICHGSRRNCARILAIFVGVVFWVSCAVPAFADLDVRSAILLNVDSGKVLYAQDADRSIQPASLTKIVSMFVALDAVKNGRVQLSEVVRVSKLAARQGGSRMFLKTGDRVSVERLLFGMAISSGNDASLAVAEKVGGTGSKFVSMMNSKVRSLGVKNTVFTNVHGLPSSKQRTTARDMATISMAYLRAHPSALRFHRTIALRHNGVVTTNKNPLLGHYSGADGLKTGWVNASGYNIVTTVQRNNTRLLAVVLGAPDSNTRAREIRKLMDAGFASLDSKLTVAEALSGNSKQYRAEAVPTKKKAEVRKQSKQSKKKQEAKRSKKSQVSKKSTVTAQKKQNSKKKVTAQKKQSGKQKVTAQKKQSGKQTASTKKNTQRKESAKTAGRQQKNKPSGWVAAGSLMDS